MWTQFWDMHSGGGLKEAPYHYIYIEAPEEEAKVIFYNRFGHNPERVTCTCCGDDYSIGEEKTLAKLTEYHRKPFGGGEIQPLKEYTKNTDVLVIRKDEIKSGERLGEVPEQGHVWQD
ncbi:hypothetical protein LCGC14_2445590 [marine sediment metagenome]|uniref:Uncharacterized protein n=1 Tax=marine sediment metagenome TaxID=412755 RepID=A0A0F9BHT4_9ZZZZ